jgi:hypothetical protein
MREIKDTGITYVNGDRILEGDIVDFEFYQFRAIPEKVRCVVTYKNAAFYLESELSINCKPAIDKTIASILENNAQVPNKHPMYINKAQPETPDLLPTNK